MVPELAEVRSPPSWMYVNEVRLIAIVTGAALVVLGIGFLIYVVGGSQHMDAVDVFLGTGVFFLLFMALLFLPRLRSRGAMSFSLLVEQPADEVEAAVLSAIEEAGQKAHVGVPNTRFRLPAHTVTLEGVEWRFVLRSAPYRERKEDGTHWTELVQAGLSESRDPAALELRERILKRLGLATP